MFFYIFITLSIYALSPSGFLKETQQCILPHTHKKAHLIYFSFKEKDPYSEQQLTRFLYLIRNNTTESLKKDQKLIEEKGSFSIETMINFPQEKTSKEKHINTFINTSKDRSLSPLYYDILLNFFEMTVEAINQNQKKIQNNFLEWLETNTETGWLDFAINETPLSHCIEKIFHIMTQIKDTQVRSKVMNFLFQAYTETTIKQDILSQLSTSLKKPEQKEYEYNRMVNIITMMHQTGLSQEVQTQWSQLKLKIYPRQFRKFLQRISTKGEKTEVQHQTDILIENDLEVHPSIYSLIYYLNNTSHTDESAHLRYLKVLWGSFIQKNWIQGKNILFVSEETNELLEISLEEILIEILTLQDFCLFLEEYPFLISCQSLPEWIETSLKTLIQIEGKDSDKKQLFFLKKCIEKGEQSFQIPPKNLIYFLWTGLKEEEKVFLTYSFHQLITQFIQEKKSTYQSVQQSFGQLKDESTSFLIFLIQNNILKNDPEEDNVIEIIIKILEEDDSQRYHLNCYNTPFQKVYSHIKQLKKEDRIINQPFFQKEKKKGWFISLLTYKSKIEKKFLFTKFSEKALNENDDTIIHFLKKIASEWTEIIESLSCPHHNKEELKEFEKELQRLIEESSNKLELTQWILESDKSLPLNLDQHHQHQERLNWLFNILPFDYFKKLMTQEHEGEKIFIKIIKNFSHIEPSCNQEKENKYFFLLNLACEHYQETKNFRDFLKHFTPYINCSKKILLIQKILLLNPQIAYDIIFSSVDFSVPSSQKYIDIIIEGLLNGEINSQKWTPDLKKYIKNQIIQLFIDQKIDEKKTLKVFKIVSEPTKNLKSKLKKIIREELCATHQSKAFLSINQLFILWNLLIKEPLPHLYDCDRENILSPSNDGWISFQFIEEILKDDKGEINTAKLSKWVKNQTTNTLLKACHWYWSQKKENNKEQVDIIIKEIIQNRGEMNKLFKDWLIYAPEECIETDLKNPLFIRALQQTNLENFFEWISFRKERKMFIFSFYIELKIIEKGEIDCIKECLSWIQEKDLSPSSLYGQTSLLLIAKLFSFSQTTFTHPKINPLLTKLIRTQVLHKEINSPQQSLLVILSSKASLPFSPKENKLYDCLKTNEELYSESDFIEDMSFYSKEDEAQNLYLLLKVKHSHQTDHSFFDIQTKHPDLESFKNKHEVWINTKLRHTLDFKNILSEENSQKQSIKFLMCLSQQTAEKQTLLWLSHIFEKENDFGKVLTPIMKKNKLTKRIFWLSLDIQKISQIENCHLTTLIKRLLSEKQLGLLIWKTLINNTSINTTTLSRSLIQYLRNLRSATLKTKKELIDLFILNLLKKEVSYHQVIAEELKDFLQEKSHPSYLQYLKLRWEITSDDNEKILILTEIFHSKSLSIKKFENIHSFLSDASQKESRHLFLKQHINKIQQMSTIANLCLLDPSLFDIFSQFWINNPHDLKDFLEEFIKNKNGLLEDFIKNETLLEPFLVLINKLEFNLLFPLHIKINNKSIGRIIIKTLAIKNIKLAEKTIPLLLTKNFFEKEHILDTIIEMIQLDNNIAKRVWNISLQQAHLIKNENDLPYIYSYLPFSIRNQVTPPPSLQAYMNTILDHLKLDSDLKVNCLSLLTEVALIPNPDDQVFWLKELLKNNPIYDQKKELFTEVYLSMPSFVKKQWNKFYKEKPLPEKWVPFFLDSEVMANYLWELLETEEDKIKVIKQVLTVCLKANNFKYFFSLWKHLSKEETFLLEFFQSWISEKNIQNFVISLKLPQNYKDPQQAQIIKSLQKVLLKIEIFEKEWLSYYHKKVYTVHTWNRIKHLFSYEEYLKFQRKALHEIEKEIGRGHLLTELLPIELLKIWLEEWNQAPHQWSFFWTHFPLISQWIIKNHHSQQLSLSFEIQRKIKTLYECFLPSLHENQASENIFFNTKTENHPKRLHTQESQPILTSA